MRMSRAGSCSVEDCDEHILAKGMCRLHYDSVRKRGHLNSKHRRTKSEIVIQGDIALIELTQGQWAIIDIEDVNKVEGYIWRYSEGYARSHELDLYLHQLIIGIAPTGMVADHEDRDRLNCRKYNLRHISHKQNLENSNFHDRAEGVYIYSRKDRAFSYQTHIGMNGRKVHLGTFTTYAEARAAYRQAKER